MDTVKATGIWVKFSSCKNKNEDLLWNTCGDPAKTSFNTLQVKFGKNFEIETPQVINRRIGYGIGFEFLCMPADLHQEKKLKFDVTRQKHTRSWVKKGEDWEILDQNSNADFPYLNDATKFYFSNDDDIVGKNEDNDNTPDQNNFIYSIDGPGYIALAAEKKLVRKCNFYEFVRVAINGNQPIGSGIHGSAVSEKQPWHAFMDFKEERGFYVEDENFVNTVDLQHKIIENENENHP